MSGDRHGFAGYCYDQQPGSPLHCLVADHPHQGDHSHWPTGETWPNLNPAPKPADR